MESRTHAFENFNEVIFTKETEKNTDGWVFPKLKPEKIFLKKDSIYKEGSRPIVCDMIYDKDVAFISHDGAKLYADIFRPADETKKFPAILIWTPYGKIDPPNNYSCYYNHANLDPAYSSGLDTMEGPDPDYWVKNEYALVVVDSRGSTNSEGDLLYFGNEESRDICEVINQISHAEWCSGNIGMFGNSWLAICQWFAAAKQPPALKAIAPWEGLSDLLHDTLLRGGIPTPEFALGINSTLRYGDMIENVYEMLKKYPYDNEYWSKEKRPDFSKINIPVYVVASWDSNVHPYGTLRAWNKIASKNKWLRIHNTQEWYDQHQSYYRDDLKKFFDHYLKGRENKWENTPKVRLSLFDPTGSDITNKPADNFPLSNTKYKALYLNSENLSLSEQQPDRDASHSYLAEDGQGSMVKYRITCTREMALCGYFKMKLYVATTEGNDMDLFAYIHKEDSLGITYYHQMLNCRYIGAEARLRISCRKIANDDITDFKHNCRNPQYIQPNEIVEAETVFWPMGLVIHEGEKLVLTISSTNLRENEFPLPPVKTVNKGNHIIYSGTTYPSQIIIPEVE